MRLAFVLLFAHACGAAVTKISSEEFSSLLDASDGVRVIDGRSGYDRELEGFVRAAEFLEGGKNNLG